MSAQQFDVVAEARRELVFPQCDAGMVAPKVQKPFRRHTGGRQCG